MSVLSGIRSSEPHHLVVIKSNLYNVDREVVAFCPDEFTMSFGNSWSTPFEGIRKKVRSMGLGKIADKASRAFGFSINSQQLTALVWEASTASQISFPLIFNADEDPEIDVDQPIANLLSMVVPEQENDFSVKIPGPSGWAYMITESAKKMSQDAYDKIAENLPKLQNVANHRISLQIGNVLTMPNIVFDSVSLVNSTKVAGLNKRSMKRIANVTVRPFVQPYLEDVKKMFNINTIN